MTDNFELVRGSGNLFRDMGVPNADVEQLKALLAARIIMLLDARKMTVRKAASQTGFAAADFSRIRNAKLGRFTIDRLMTILSRFGEKIDVQVKVRNGKPRPQRTRKAA